MLRRILKNIIAPSERADRSAGGPGRGLLVIETPSREVPVFVVRGRGRRLRITVLSDGRVRASVPRGVTLDEAAAFIRGKAGWIEKAVRNRDGCVHLHSPAEAADTGKITFLGRTYPVVVERGRGRRAVFREGRLVVPAVDPDDHQTVERRTAAWLRAQAETVFAEAIRRGLEDPVFKGLQEPPFSMRWMKRRWGSCSLGGHIILNIRLVQVQPRLVEYVVLHELCHLKEHNHGRPFYALLARCLPDWKERRREINLIAVE